MTMFFKLSSTPARPQRLSVDLRVTGAETLRDDFREKTKTITAKLDGHDKALTKHAKDRRAADATASTKLTAVRRAVDDGVVKLSSDMAAMSITFTQSAARMSDALNAGVRSSEASAAATLRLTDERLTAQHRAIDERMKAIDEMEKQHKKMKASLMGTMAAIEVHISQIPRPAP
jgi:hypothetical protein